MGDIIIEEINYKAFVLVLVNLLLVITASIVTVIGIAQEMARYWLPGILVVFLSVIGFMATALKVMKVKKILIITRDGIIDNSTLSAIGFISFEEIKEFVIVTINNKKAIAVIPKDIESFLIQLNVVKRSLVKRNLNQNLPAVAIQVDKAKDMEPEDILTMLQKRLADFVSMYD